MTNKVPFKMRFKLTKSIIYVKVGNDDREVVIHWFIMQTLSRRRENRRRNFQLLCDWMK